MVKCKVHGCKAGASSNGHCKNHFEELQCKVCKEVCDDGCHIQCELCEKWNHIECVNLSEEMFNLLGKIKGTKWFCNTCISVINTRIIGHQNFEHQSKDLKSSIQDLKSGKNQFDNIQKKIEEF